MGSNFSLQNDILQMKKIVLSLLSLFSVSLAFANDEKKDNEKQPAVITTVEVKKSTIPQKDALPTETKVSENQPNKVSHVECFGLSCGTRCFNIDGQLDADTSVIMFYVLDYVVCDKFPTF
jgi:hypothetical protein